MTAQRLHTIADIARLTGVSKATVSRALNDSPLVAVETRERIQAVAREHGFQMNASARRLSLKQAHVVALMTYAYKAGSTVTDAFMLEVMSGVAGALHTHDYDLLVIQVGPTDTDWVPKYLDTGRVDGFVLLSGTCSPRQLRTLVETKAPFAMWAPRPADGHYCTVSGDSFAGGEMAAAHLLSVGRRRIAFLGGPATGPEVQDRHRGYVTALERTGEMPDPSLVAYASWWPAEITGAEAMRELLARAPDLDAVFACSDLLALAAMEVLREEGRRIPEDVAVVGYDDVALARHTNPALTTIRQSGPLAGRLLAETLLQHLETGVVTNVSIPAELVVRESA
jgi:DNA-binding LacI/PurR family transcriptional regulator